MIAKSIIHGTISAPTRLDVAKWVNNAMAEMKSKSGIVRNAWKKIALEWFVSGDGVGGEKGYK
jgi:hypothetical protein